MSSIPSSLSLPALAAPPITGQSSSPLLAAAPVAQVPGTMVVLVAVEQADTPNAVVGALVAGQAGCNRRQVDILRMRSAVVAVHCVAVALVEVVAGTAFEEVAVDIPGQEVAWLDIGWAVVVVVGLVSESEVVAGCDT